MADERLANVLGAFALALNDQVTEATERAAGHAGAGPAAVVALSELLAGRSVDDLRRAVGLTHSGGVRVVDRLVDGRLAERRPGADGRSVALVLTPAGRRLARHVGDARQATLQSALDGLDHDERAHLGTILEKLLATLVARRLEVRAAGAAPAGGWLCRLCDPVACERAQGRCPVANAATRHP